MRKIVAFAAQLIGGAGVGMLFAVVGSFLGRQVGPLGKPDDGLIVSEAVAGSSLGYLAGAFVGVFLALKLLGQKVPFWLALLGIALSWGVAFVLYALDVQISFVLLFFAPLALAILSFNLWATHKGDGTGRY